MEEEEGRPVMVKRKLDGAVDESSVDRKIRKWDMTVHNLHLAEPGLTAGWLADEIWARLEILKACCRSKNLISALFSLRTVLLQQL